jgi:hypothetical protein
LFRFEYFPAYFSRRHLSIGIRENAAESLGVILLAAGHKGFSLNLQNAPFSMECAHMTVNKRVTQRNNICKYLELLIELIGSFKEIL